MERLYFFIVGRVEMVLKGRREIFTDYKEITKENICEVFTESFNVHLINANEITQRKSLSITL